VPAKELPIDVVGGFRRASAFLHNWRVASQLAHWQRIYEEHWSNELSWYQPVAKISLALIEASGLSRDASIIDVGGGSSRLAAELLDAGFTDITVADLSSAALDRAKSALGERQDRITWIEADVREHDFGRRFDLWHDRALFHFMVDASDRKSYLDNLSRSLRPGGRAVLATFGPEGPTSCSGLPVRRYGEAELLALLGTGLQPISSELEMHRTPSGASQQFIYLHLARTPDAGS
jgi:SAM-dependent methyltransferase